MNELIKKWHLKADSDIKNASHEIQHKDAATDTICFHAQQAVEKYLKSFIIWKEATPPKTHNIDILLKMCLDLDRNFEILKDKNISYLTSYAVEFRYPDDYYMPTIEEAEEAYNTALFVKDFVIERLQESGYSDVEED